MMNSNQNAYGIVCAVFLFDSNLAHFFVMFKMRTNPKNTTFVIILS